MDLFDHRLTFVVLQLDPQLRDSWTQLLGREAAYIAFAPQRLQHVGTQLRRGRHAAGVTATLRVANTREHVAQWIRHRHGSASLPARLDHARDLTRAGEVAQRDTAQLELAVVRL